MLVFEKCGIGFWIELIIVYAITIPVKSLGNAEILPIQESTKEGIRVCIIVAATIVAHIIRRFIIDLAKEQYQPVYIFIVAASSVSVYSWYDNKGQDLDLFFIILIFGLCDLSKPEHSHQYETQSKYLASGMAWQFYFGYFKIQMTETKFDNMFKDARTDDRLVGIINDVPNVNYIIIPRDGNCDKDLNQMQNVKNILKNIETKQNTGGNVERSYRLQFYEVTHNNEKRNILLEYAPPVRTFYRMYESANTGFTKEDLKREVMLLYAKLKEILESHKEEAKYIRLVLVDSMENAGDEIAKRLFEASENDFEDLNKE